jgi:hypothetical protein
MAPSLKELPTERTLSCDLSGEEEHHRYHIYFHRFPECASPHRDGHTKSLYLGPLRYTAVVTQKTLCLSFKGSQRLFTILTD